MQVLPPPGELDDNLGLQLLVEPVIAFGDVIKALQLGRDDEARLRTTRLDELQQNRDDGLRVYSAALHAHALLPPLSHGKRDVRRERRSARRAPTVRLGEVNANDTDAAAGRDDTDCLVDDKPLIRLKLLVETLEADAVTDARGAVRSNLQDLISGLALCKVDGNSSDGFGLLQAGRDVIYREDAAGTPQNGTVGAKKTDWSGTEDSDIVPGLEAGEVETSPRRSEDVRQEQKLVVRNLVVFNAEERLVCKRDLTNSAIGPCG